MKKIIKLTESDLTRIVKRVINESNNHLYYEAIQKIRINPEKSLSRVDQYTPKNKEQFVDKNFYTTFIESVMESKPMTPPEYIGDRLAANMNLFNLL